MIRRKRNSSPSRTKGGMKSRRLRQWCLALTLAGIFVWLIGVATRTTVLQSPVVLETVTAEQAKASTTTAAVRNARGADGLVVDGKLVPIEEVATTRGAEPIAPAARQEPDDSPRVNAAPAVAEAADEVPAENVLLGNNEIDQDSPFVDLSSLEFYTDLPGISDKSGKYVLHPFYQIADGWETLRYKKVCLVTQTSVDRLHWLVNASSTWTSHFSVAVFAPAHEFHLAQMAIAFIRECSTSVRERVSFHLVSLVDHPPELISEPVPKNMLTCANVRQSLDALAARLLPPDMKIWRETMKYPQNTLRNWAKSGCDSDRRLVVDVDMIPSRGMADELELFYSNRSNPLAMCRKCLIVVPTYEINSAMGRFPADKAELVTWVSRGQARIFHMSFWPRSCRSSRLQDWEKIPAEPMPALAYNITKIELQYEPIYIGPSDAPEYDERFVGYGHDRYTQFYEMYLANYTFHVLNNPFTSHWEFQEDKYRPAWRKRQRSEALSQAWQFARELVFKYKRDPLGFEPYLRKKVQTMAKQNGRKRS